MIKIALKHWVYDTCINILFERIINNFCLPINKRIKKGMIFSKMITQYPYHSKKGLYATTTYYNVHITRVSEQTKYYETITFSCDKIDIETNDETVFRNTTDKVKKVGDVISYTNNGHRPAAFVYVDQITYAE